MTYLFKYIAIPILITVATTFGIQNYVPLKYIDFLVPQKFGTTITTIAGTDTISGSRTTINTNFTNLNSGKIEVGSTTINAITTLPNLVSLGTITTGTWTGTAITTAKGGTSSTTLSIGQVLTGSTTNAIGTVDGWGTSGQLLTSQGVSRAPSWASPSVDQTVDYSWTGSQNFVHSTTTNATTTNAYIGGKLGLNSIYYTTPSAQGAASSTLMNNGSGGLKWGNPYLIAEPSETLQVSGDTERQTNQVHTDSIAGTRMKQAQIYYAGKVRVKFDFETEITDPAVTATAWIITNNTATSTYNSATYDFATTTHVAYFSTHTADVNVSEGDVIEIWAKSSASGRYTAVKNFRIYFDLIAATTTARISIN